MPVVWLGSRRAWTVHGSVCLRAHQFLASVFKLLVCRSTSLPVRVQLLGAARNDAPRVRWNTHTEGVSQCLQHRLGFAKRVHDDGPEFGKSIAP